MNLIHLLQDCNPGKFLVRLNLVIFVVLITLCLDGTIKANYWIIFTPLWIWKFSVLIAVIIGICSWCRCPRNSLDEESSIHFRSMLLTSSVHFLLAFFEVLVCDKLQSGRHMWILVFLPLLFLSVICIIISIWALKHERPFEVELFFSLNLLQLIFIPLKLDNFIAWKWELVFIPEWIIFGVAVLGLFYTILLAAVFTHSSSISSEQRRASTQAALGYSLSVIPSLASLVLLSKKLDGELDLPYSVIFIPLMMALVTLLLRSFNARGGNLWWCGMQKDFFLFLLDLAPSLREYGNISFSVPEGRSVHSRTPESAILSPRIHQRSTTPKSKTKFIKVNDSRTAVPILSIDIPD